MSTGIVIVTHGDIGEALRSEAEFITGESLASVACISFDGSEGDTASIAASIEQADTGDGVLVLADLIGASPANQVEVLLEAFDSTMVTGVNLAMLLCAWANRDMPLSKLTRKAVDCGRRSTKIFQK